MTYSGCITVEDASGARFEVHEYRRRGLLARVRRFMLDTGEPVKRIDAHVFEIATTGEKLVRVEQA